jgi:hypothetical protein
MGGSDSQELRRRRRRRRDRGKDRVSVIITKIRIKR